MSNRLVPRWLRLPVMLLAATAVVVLGWLIYSKVFLSDALVMPLGVADGQWTSPPFRVSARNDYRAALEIDKTFSFHKTECLLDVGMPYPDRSDSGPPGNCPTTFKAPDVTWEILENSQRLHCTQEFPPNTGGYGSTTIEREFCELSLRPHAEYVARISVRGAPTVWRQASPRFKVMLEPMVIETAAAMSMLVFVTATLLLLATAITALLGWFKSRASG